MKNYTILTMLLAHCLIAWGQNWLPLGNGVNNGYNGGTTLQSYNGKLIVGGAFNRAGTVNANGVAMWDGVDWSIVDSTMNNFFAVRSLVIFRGQLYGFVSPIFGPAGYIIRLDSSFHWHVVPNSNFLNRGQRGYIYSAAVYHDELYLGGQFDSIGTIQANHIAKWDGANWTSVGTGIDDEYVLGMTVYGNELYVGGIFQDAGGVSVHDLARWDGAIWKDVGGGLSGNTGYTYRCMKVFHGELYIGGSFLYAGGQPMQDLVKWNGTMFSGVLSGGVGHQGVLDALAVYGNRLIINGYFGAGMFAHQTGTWDDVRFDSLGAGLSTGPTVFEVYNGRLYAGGRFRTNDGAVADGIAVLDTTGFTVGTPEYDLPDLSISIYPNPFTSQTTISFETAQKNTAIRITDILGKEILSSIITGRQFVIDGTGMHAGIYWVQLKDPSNHIRFEKIVVQ